jgi:hypothetical protein
MSAPSPGPLPPRPPRWFSADDILSGRVTLDGYPFQYIYITAQPSDGFRITFAGPATIAAAVDRVFSAAEFLESRGWQVVSFEQHGQVAYLRRVSR